MTDWYAHFLLANIVSDWHRSEFKLKMKRKGLKPRKAPLPGRLWLLPCKMLVMTQAVMLTMHTVAAAAPTFKSAPPTAVEVVGGVRGLLEVVPVLPALKKPPDPTLDGEGRKLWLERQKVKVNQVKEQKLDETMEALEKDEEWKHFKISTGCSKLVTTASEHWEDLEKHVLSCNLGSFTTSFGPIGLMADSTDKFEAIVDTGASVTITPCREDFITYEKQDGLVVNGLTKGAAIAGIGLVEWLVEVNGTTVSLKLRALHVPEAKKRLLCPQQVRNEIYPGKLEPGGIGDKGLDLHFPEGTVHCPYNEGNLPTIILSAPKETQEHLSAMNGCMQLEHHNNLNMNGPMKELLKWHTRLGHIGLKQVQNIMKTGGLGHSPLIRAASKINLQEKTIVCSSCAYGKAKRRSKLTKGHQIESQATKPMMQEKLLSKETLIPGQKVSMDHFIVSTPGRLFSSRGRESQDSMYKGGLIFVDHASTYVHVEPVVNFTAGEAVRAKRAFESEMHSMGVTVVNYHSDNGVFTAAEFQDELIKLSQDIKLSGVGAHHQNAVAERMIGVVVSMARTMMLHAKMRWPKAIGTKLWPMAMKHAQHLYNNVPNMNNVCPLDMILKTTVPRNHLRNMHVWGSPCYVLDPKLQDGGHIPKFEPRSRQGVNLGWSPRHASTVPLVLNLTTGHVSPQFHVLFDDGFTSVDSSEQSIDDGIESEEWQDILSNGRFLVTFDDDDPIELDDEWLTETERLERHHKATARVQSKMPDGPTKTPLDLPQQPEQPKPEAPTDPKVDPPPQERSPKEKQQQQREPDRPTETPMKREMKQLGTPPAVTKRLRPKAGTFKGMVAGMIALLGNTAALQAASHTVGRPAAYAAMQGYDFVTETFDWVEPHTYKAVYSTKNQGKKGLDPDFPTYAQAMMSPEADEWKEAMDKEIATLLKMNTWTVVPRSMARKMKQHVIKTTWALRQKRDPAGNPTKKKGRCCVRGDIQKRLEETEAYSPVCQWSSVRLMLILSIVHGLETRQVDCVNAFAQADLDKDVFIEIPQGYEHMNSGDDILKLNKSLYGMTDAPLIFFELLKSKLEEVGFKQYKDLDPCLFVHKKAIVLTYVDDCLWFSKDGAALDRLIQDTIDAGLDMTIESRDVSAFLGIQFTRSGDTIELKQVGLIDKVIEATGMQGCTPQAVPADAKTLGKDKDGPAFKETWNYRSVVGMLLYLAGNSRPDIAFAVHQAARFSHDPRQSHAVAVKKIVRYLKGTRDKGMKFKPTDDWRIDCHVDADFCGLWGSENPEDPIVSKSRTGYIITLAGCPLLWVSKLQTETSVSTMMAEYVALSTAMRDMLPLKRLVKTIAKVVTGDDEVRMVTKSDVFEDNNGALTVATLPRITPQSKFFAVKLHFFKEHVKTENNPHGEVEIKKIDTTKQLADIMTKGLVADKFTPLRDALMGWDMDENGVSKLFANLHSRGSVGNVSLDSPSVLYALVCALEYDV